MARGRTYRRRRNDGTWGRWHAVIDLPRPPGAPRRQITRTFDTERAAHRWLAEVATQVPQPEDAKGELDVATHLTAWLDRVHVRASTLATYRSHVALHLIPALGPVPLRALDRAAVQRLADTMLASGLEPATVRRTLSTLSSAMRDALLDGHIPRNPVQAIAVPGSTGRPLPKWTADDCRAFLAALGPQPLDVCLRLALVTGMRRGELLGLRWGDLDLIEATVQVRRARVAVGSEVVEGPPKTMAGQRTVYLDVRTVHDLTALRKQVTLPVPWLRDTPVFAHKDGSPWPPAWLSAQFTRLVERIGLPRIRLHDLRHASATLGLASGETLREISARLGHADIAVTARIYTEVVPQMARSSTARRAAFLEPTTLHPTASTR